MQKVLTLLQPYYNHNEKKGEKLSQWDKRHLNMSECQL